MTMPAEFQSGTDWQQSSEPFLPANCMEPDAWPVGARSESGTKDLLADGLHPVIAIGPVANRPTNLTGVVATYHAGLTQATGIAVVNVAPGAIVRQWVCNILTYTGEAPATFESTPQPGQPVYIDDSADLSAGVTLSFSPLNHAGNPNPLAGYLWYCQDEYADISVGGPNALPTFDTTMLETLQEQEFCIILKGVCGGSVYYGAPA